jgi:hypothetical protein
MTLLTTLLKIDNSAWQEVFQVIGVFVGGVIAAISPKIIDSIKTKLNKKVEIDSFTNSNIIATEINNELLRIQGGYDAARVAILEYHNGVYSKKGLPFEYSSMRYEVTDHNTRSLMNEFQAVPVSPVAEMLLNLENSEEGYFKVHTDEEPDNILSRTHKYYGVKTAYTFKLFDTVKEGVLNIVWISNKKDLTDEEIVDIQISIFRISNLMLKLKK